MAKGGKSSPTPPTSSGAAKTGRSSGRGLLLSVVLIGFVALQIAQSDMGWRCWTCVNIKYALDGAKVLVGLIPGREYRIPETDLAGLTRARSSFNANIELGKWTFLYPLRFPIDTVPSFSFEVNGIRVRGYTSTGNATPVPGRNRALIYFHGGGHVFGGLDTMDHLCRRIALHTQQLTIFNVDYRLAPEHKFPAGLDDAFAVIKYISEHGLELNVDTSRIAVGGESAGGNMASALVLKLRSEGHTALLASIRRQILIYPWVDMACPHCYESMSMYGDGSYLLSGSAIDSLARMFVSRKEMTNPLASPVLAPEEWLVGLPEALVITAELDPIRDEGEAYAARLQAAGVKTILKRFPATIHGFLNVPLDQHEEAVALIVKALDF